MRFLAPLLALCFVLSSSAAIGQDADAKALIRDAYEETKTAKTADDYTAVIGACQQAAAARLDEQQQAYINTLLGWAHNARGEAHVQAAGDLLTSDRQEQAAEREKMALADFEKSIEHDQSKWKPYHNRGVSYAQVGRFEEAEADFTRAIELKGDYANAWFNRAEVRLELGNNNGAISDYNKYLQLSPNDVAAHTGRGHALFALKRFDEAVVDYNYAVSLARLMRSPEREGALSRALVNQADAYRSLGEWEFAAGAYRGAIAADAANGRAYERGAWMAATCPDEDFRDADLAMRLSQRAIELDGESAGYLDTLAAAQANAGQFEAASATLKKAISSAGEAATDAMKQRLALYESGKPFRDEAAE